MKPLPMLKVGPGTDLAALVTQLYTLGHMREGYPLNLGISSVKDRFMRGATHITVVPDGRISCAEGVVDGCILVNSPTQMIAYLKTR